MSIEKSENYTEFLKEIKGRVQKAQYAALKAVNSELISLYWDLGRMIVEKQEQFKWGEGIVKQLSKDLKVELEGMSGLSPQNLWNMRRFYLAYRDNQILQTLSGEISWSHNVLILDKAKDDKEREFYLKLSKKFGWSYRELVRQIENKAYEGWLLNQTNFDQTIDEERSIMTQIN